MLTSRIVLVALMGLAFVAPAVQAQTTSQTTTQATTTDDEMVVATPHSASVPTATAAAAKPASDTKPMTTDEQLKAWIDDAPKLNRTPATDADADDSSDPDAPVKRQIHGSAGVAIGSNGYSSAYVSSLIPVGKDSTLGIAVSQADWGGNTVDHGRYRTPKGRSQSVAISLDIGSGNGKTPDGCPGFMDQGRYIEPVWWSRLHPDQECTSETDLHNETYPGQ